MRRMLIPVVVALLVVATLAHAVTILVNWNGTGHYETMGEGIGAAGIGDTVLVAPGTYTGENNRNLVVSYEMTIMSEGGRRSVTINAEGQGRVFWFTDYSASAVLSGFTILNGDGGLYGGGIVCDGSSTIISDCEISACTVSHKGGGCIASTARPRPSPT